MLGLRFCVRAFSSCGKREPLFITMCGPLTIAASPVAKHRLQACRLSSCGSRAQLLRGMWDLPRPGLEPVSPALAGRFSTTAPPGKPLLLVFEAPQVTQIVLKDSKAENVWGSNMKDQGDLCIIHLHVVLFTVLQLSPTILVQVQPLGRKK